MKQVLFILLITFISRSIFAQGLTKNGQITSTGSSFVDKNGAIGASTGVDKNGKIVAASLAVGSDYQGGKILYFFVSGDPGYVAGQQHGLIAATSDLSIAQWGCYGTAVTGTVAGIGYGNANTVNIVAGCATAGIAARLCSDLVLNSYSDWYLPSINELIIFQANQAIIGGYDAANHYWSSTEESNAFNARSYAYIRTVSNTTSAGGKNDPRFAVRPIRTF